MKLHDRYIDHLFDALKVNEKGVAFDNKTTLALLEELRASRRAREKVRGVLALVAQDKDDGSAAGYYGSLAYETLADADVKEWLG